MIQPVRTASLLLALAFLATPISVSAPESARLDAEEDFLPPPPGDSARVELIDSDTRALLRARRVMVAKDEAIRVGEKLVYSVRYGFIRAGEASLEIAGVEEVGGHPCYHVVSLARSNSFFDRIFRVRDRVESWMDRDFLFSRRFHKSLREGSTSCARGVISKTRPS